MSPSERSNREAAGRWLREQRRRKGFETVGSFARAIGVDTSRVSSYETGRSEVPDDRAEQIAKVLGLDIIEVRRHLGLWVPPERKPTTDENLTEAEKALTRIEKALDARDGERQERQRKAVIEALRAMIEDTASSNGPS